MEIYASSQNFEKFGIDQQQWEIENENYIININPPSPKVPYTIYTIRLVQSDFNTPPSWLKVNSDFIEYELSSENIENDHIIRDHLVKDDIDNLINENASIYLSGADLIQNGCSFDTLSYQQYMSFVNNQSSININLVSDFNQTTYCYSFPLFWALKSNNNEKNINDCLFNFVQVAIDGNVTIAFRVNFSDGNKKYYDFTDRA